jgi:hypothetical protein
VAHCPTEEGRNVQDQRYPTVAENRGPRDARQISEEPVERFDYDLTLSAKPVHGNPRVFTRVTDHHDLLYLLGRFASTEY